MKKYFNIALSAVVCLGAISLISCDGGTETVNTDITSLTLEPSKTTLEANDKDVVQFVIKDQDGRDVSKTVGFRVMDVTSGDYLDGDLKVTAFMNGDMKFIARGNGLKSDEVTITAENRSKYEKYFRYVGMYVATGTWCQYCPNMTKALNEYKDIPGRMIRMAYHINNQSGSPQDPFEIPASSTLVSKMGIQGYPSGVIDLHSVITGYNAFTITGGLKNTLKNYPATCGVKIISSTYSDGSVTVKPEVTFEKEGEYSVGLAVTVSDIEAPQKMPDASVSNTYMHENVVCGVDNIFGTTIGKQAAGSTWTPQTDLKVTGLKHPAKNMTVVVFVCKKQGDNYYINNLTACPANGGSVDYKLND